jgi:hypothetical protein
MTEKDLQFYKDWYSEYSNSFHTHDKEDWKNLSLKIEHTDHVCEHIAGIARDLTLSNREVMLAETIALFHDLGRFRQYSKYKTFQDRKSRNHGLLGVTTLLENSVLHDLPDKEQSLILQSIKFHNAYAIPNIFNDYSKLFLKMIRDSDKLDIFRVFTKYYEGPAEERASETAFGLPDADDYSKIIITCMNNRQSVPYRHLRNENDFKLLKLSWIYGLHFNYSLKLVQENDYVNRIADKLPQTDEIMLAVANVKEYISAKLSLSSN